MPISKHRKKGKTAREWRRKRNIARADARGALRTERLGYLRMQRMFDGELTKELAKELVKENEHRDK